jgi:SPIRAL1-like protein
MSFHSTAPRSQGPSSGGNTGNSISGRPSSKVLAPPGGATSWSMGWGSEPAPAEPRRGRGSGLAAPPAAAAYEPRAHAPAEAAAADPYSAYSAPAAAAPAAFAPPPPRALSSVSSNAYASGANQNAGNVLTDRPTSKVLAPPGGATSWSMGWGSEPAPAEPRRGRGAGASAPLESAPAAYGGAAYAPPAPAPAAYSAPAEPAYSAYGGGGGGAMPQEPPATRFHRVSSNAYASGANQNAGNVLTDRPTSKVLAPPGGRSSITFG